MIIKFKELADKKKVGVRRDIEGDLQGSLGAKTMSQFEIKAEILTNAGSRDRMERHRKGFRGEGHDDPSSRLKDVGMDSHLEDNPGVTEGEDALGDDCKFTTERKYLLRRGCPRILLKRIMLYNR